MFTSFEIHYRYKGEKRKHVEVVKAKDKRDAVKQFSPSNTEEVVEVKEAW